MPATVLKRIIEAIAVATAIDGDHPLAVGWATIDLDRAASELVDALRLTPDAFQPAEDSIALGGRCRIAPGALPEGQAVVLLEPFTEGRLAGRLARLGEGPVALWLPFTAAPVVKPVGKPGGISAGPFGDERLLSGGPAQGPYRILILSAPGTIPP